MKIDTSNRLQVVAGVIIGAAMAWLFAEQNGYGAEVQNAILLVAGFVVTSVLQQGEVQAQVADKTSDFKELWEDEKKAADKRAEEMRIERAEEMKVIREKYEDVIQESAKKDGVIEATREDLDKERQARIEKELEWSRRFQGQENKTEALRTDMDELSRKLDETIRQRDALKREKSTITQERDDAKTALEQLEDRMAQRIEDVRAEMKRDYEAVIAQKDAEIDQLTQEIETLTKQIEKLQTKNAKEKSDETIETDFTGDVSASVPSATDNSAGASAGSYQHQLWLRYFHWKG